MVINDINSAGGLLGRQIDLYLEDSATTDRVAEAKLLAEYDKLLAADVRIEVSAYDEYAAFNIVDGCRSSLEDLRNKSERASVPIQY
jgi:hypothetical protein